MNANIIVLGGWQHLQLPIDMLHVKGSFHNPHRYKWTKSPMYNAVRFISSINKQINWF